MPVLYKLLVLLANVCSGNQVVNVAEVVCSENQVAILWTNCRQIRLVNLLGLSRLLPHMQIPRFENCLDIIDPSDPIAEAANDLKTAMAG